MNLSKSRQAFKELSKLTPGAVNSPFRSFHEVGGDLLFLSHGKGAHVWDIDKNRYIDFLGAWGPAILGHAYPSVVKAAKKAVDGSSVLGLSSLWEIEMAKLVREAFPSMEKIRFVNSGAEAVESAIRLARGATQRSTIIRFIGGYHGHGDSVLWTYGPEENNAPQVAGVPPGLANQTVYAPFNNLEKLETVFKAHPGEISALLVEPVAGSMSVIPPSPNFLKGCRDLSHRHGALLIFDEVLTGFRIAFGGAQERYNIKADLTCLGKIVGGGLPAGGYGGNHELMNHLAPFGPIYQAGTFSGNPVTMQAGAATLKALKRKSIYQKLEMKTDQFLKALKNIADAAKVPMQTPHVGSMFAITFSKNPIRNYAESLQIDSKRYARFFRSMLKQGVLFPPSHTDAAVVSIAHSTSDFDAAIAAVGKWVKEENNKA